MLKTKIDCEILISPPNIIILHKKTIAKQHFPDKYAVGMRDE